MPDDSMVPSRLISGTIVQTVKVWMQRMMKIGRSVGFATRNAKYLDALLAMKNENAKRNLADTAEQVYRTFTIL